MSDGRRYFVKFGSLFSGIGGLDLGLERAGMECCWQVEWSEWCRKVLHQHWPNIPQYGDIKELTGSELEPVDLICGGFPCQPVSLAGKRLAQEDERWLWPHFARLIRVLRPRYALMENVPGLLSAGLGDVLGDLAEIGYDAEWECVSAESVGAPHLRRRIFIIAHANSDLVRDEQVVGTECSTASLIGDNGTSRELANSDCSGLEGFWTKRQLRETGQEIETGGGRQLANAEGEYGERSVTTRDRGRGPGTPFRDRRVGKIGQPFSIGHASGPSRSEWWEFEPDVGRVANGVSRRVDRLRGLGNAVVPQVAEYVGRCIMACG